METYLKSLTKEQDVARNAEEKVVKMQKNVKHAKVKAESYKCIKWVQACISKFKKIAINVKVKVKLLVKEENAKLATVRKFKRKKKLLKQQLRKVCLTTIQ